MVALIFVEVNGFKTSKVLSNVSHLSPSREKKIMSKKQQFC